MILVDTALAARAKEGRPVCVGIFGAGFMAKGLISQISRYSPGMTVGCVCNRTLEAARAACLDAGIASEDIVEAGSAEAANQAMEMNKTAITSDPSVLNGAGLLDVAIEATGHVEYGAKVTVGAIQNGLDMVLMNAELDSTVGPLLAQHARAAGTILSGCDGDQPGVQINLLRFVEQMGLIPRVCGNIKGLQDRYRNPTTQASFAKQWGQTAHMVTSFADGTKISFEQAIVANATGMVVSQRGMIGHEFKGHVDEMVSMYDLDRLRELGGIVEYVVGAKPSPGVYVFAEANDNMQKHYLNYGKLGEGPLYSFYVPYHLTVFEVPISAARVALFKDEIIAPKAGPVVDVIAMAKTDLKAGQTIDGLGGYLTYGICENYGVVRKENLLPVGIAENAILKKDVFKDTPLTYDDVDLPGDSLACRLRSEQDKAFPV